MKRYEVEQKFRVERSDSVLEKLRQMGGRESGQVEQADWYFRHPARDFALTDEALRIRQVGQSNFVTYKGPRIDTATKTRREIELPLPEGDRYAAKLTELLEALGFARVAVVQKRRRTFDLSWRGQDIEIAFDDVTGLGQFVELEVAADDEDLEQAKEIVGSLASQLGLENSEPRSYLEMLLESG